MNNYDINFDAKQNSFRYYSEYKIIIYFATVKNLITRTITQ